MVVRRECWREEAWEASASIARVWAEEERGLVVVVVREEWRRAMWAARRRRFVRRVPARK